MRCFVGIRLGVETREALVRACSAVREADSGWRTEKWVAADNLHVTVAFLGEVAPGTAAGLAAAIGRELQGADPFDLPFVQLRPVPNARRATMLWAEFSDPKGHGAALVAGIGQACSEFDIALESRAFKPHVTLVRARRPRRAGESVFEALAHAGAGVPGFVSVPSVTLFASTLSKGGPSYEVLDEWVFLG